MGKQAAPEMTVVSTTARNMKVPVFPRHTGSICFTDLCTSGIVGSYVTSAFHILGTPMLFSRRASSFHMPTKRYPKQQMYKLQQNNARNMKKQNNMTCPKKLRPIVSCTHGYWNRLNSRWRFQTFSGKNDQWPEKGYKQDISLIQSLEKKAISTEDKGQN